MGCRPVPSRLITSCHPPFNITVVQVYAPTSDYGDNETEDFCDQLQNVTDQTPKKDILLCKETGMQKQERVLMKTDKVFADPSAETKQTREDSDFWSLPPGVSPNGHHSRTNYILARKHF